MKNTLLDIGMYATVAISGLILMNANAVPAKAADESVAPSCDISATPNTIEVGGGTNLEWTLGDGVVTALLYPKDSEHLIGDMSSRDSWWISGIVDSRDYTLIVANEAGERASCSAHVEVTIEDNTGDDNNDSGDDTDNGDTNNDSNDSSDLGQGGDNVISVANVDKKKHHDDDNKYKKYRGSHNKKIYKIVKGWKKHDKALYYEYKEAYRKYQPLSNDERRAFWNAPDYEKYRYYKIYKKYKAYKKAK